MNFVNAMQSPLGRLARGLAGVALILIGLLAVRGPWGVVLAIVGLLPLFAGVARLCFAAPLFGADLRQHA